MVECDECCSETVEHSLETLVVFSLAGSRDEDVIQIVSASWNTMQQVIQQVLKGAVS